MRVSKARKKMRARKPCIKMKTPMTCKKTKARTKQRYYLEIAS